MYMIIIIIYYNYILFDYYNYSINKRKEHELMSKIENDEMYVEIDNYSLDSEDCSDDRRHYGSCQFARATSVPNTTTAANTTAAIV